MNMQAMMMQAQKIQRELKKAHDAVNAQEFTVSKSGIVSVVVLGNKNIKEIKIEEDALNKDDKEMVEDTIALAINEAFSQIDEAHAEINLKITGRREGLSM